MKRIQKITESQMRVVPLRDLCRLDLRQVIPGTNDAATLPYVGMEDIESGTGRFLSWPHEADVRSNTFAFDVRHVLYGKLRPYLNKVALPDRPGRCSTELLPLLPAPGVDRQYVAWLLRRPETVAAAMQDKTGSRMPRASMTQLMTLTVPLPSLAEQQHIVAKLDEQMAAVDRAEKALAEQQAAASDFLQAALEAVFDLAAHPAWPQVRLGAVSDVIDRKVDPQQHTSQMYAHYSIPAFDTGEGPIFELGSEIRSAKCEVADGCVLFSKLNPRIPRVWHVHDHVDVPRICSTEFLVLQPKLEHVIATYLTWILQSPPFLRTIRSRVQAATKSRERVPENVVVSTPILVPSLGEQQRIVAKLDEQMMSLGLVQSALAHQTADLGGLRSTLLNAVFSGEV
jgi:type I restriction enzyme S subunit